MGILFAGTARLNYFLHTRGSGQLAKVRGAAINIYILSRTCTTLSSQVDGRFSLLGGCRSVETYIKPNRTRFVDFCFLIPGTLETLQLSFSFLFCNFFIFHALSSTMRVPFSSIILKKDRYLVQQTENSRFVDCFE